MRRRVNSAALLVMSLFLATIICGPVKGKIIYVDDDGHANFNNIQLAIDYAKNGDIVEVLPGTYTGEGNRDIDFRGKAIIVRGATGDPNDCVIDCQGDVNERHRGFKFASNETSTSVLNGFTITNGYGPTEEFFVPGSGTWSYSTAGAVLCRNSGPLIINCIIRSNTAYSFAGGIYNFESNTIIRNCIFNSNFTSSAGWGAGVLNKYSNITLTDCLFFENSTSNPGGGIYNSDSTVDINNCQFNSNVAGLCGGGIYNSDSHVSIRNCSFKDNSMTESSRGGGGVANSYDSIVTISDCTFINNEGYNGGGVWNNQGSFKLKDCIFIGNTGRRDGGGLYNYYSGSPSVDNCTFIDNVARSGGGILNYYSDMKLSNSCFSNNTASEHGGGMFSLNLSNPILENCTFTGNSANSGGGLCSMGGNDTEININNCIIWGNSSEQVHNYGPMNISYSNIQNGLEGVGNISEDPLLAEDGIHLLPGSPCINTGDPNYNTTSNDIDIDGDARLIGRVDIGADEYFSTDKPYMSCLPNEFQVSVPEGRGICPTLNFNIYNVGIPTLNWQVLEEVEWISVNPLSGATFFGEENSIAVNIETLSLSKGQYQGALTVTDPTALNSPQFVDINLVVVGPAISVTPPEINFAACKEDIKHQQQVLTITNPAHAGGTLNWQMTTDCNWIIAEPYSGQSSGEDVNVTVGIDVNQIEYGYNNCLLVIFDPNASNSPQFVTVNLDVLRPEIKINPAEITVDVNIYDPNTFKTGLGIQNTSCDTLCWTISGHEDCQWMDIYPEQGKSDGEENQVTIIFDVNFLYNPYYSHTLTVQDSNAGNSPQLVTVHVNVLRPEISINPAVITVDVNIYDPNTFKTGFSIKNTGYHTLSWTISSHEDCQWMDIYPEQGTSDGEENQVTVIFDVNFLQNTSYTHTLIVQDSNAGNSPQTVTINVNVLRPRIYTSTSYIEVNMHVGDSNIITASFDIQNSGNGVLNWTITGFEDCNWLSAYPVSGQSKGEINEVTLSVDVKGMDFGFYTCELTISDPNASNSPLTVQVALRAHIEGQRHVPKVYSTIQAAIDSSVDGDEVIIEPGIYTGLGNSDIGLRGKAITVRSVDPNNPAIVAATIIEPNTYDHGFYISGGEQADSVVDGLTIRRYMAWAGILCFRSSPTIRNCIIGDTYGFVLSYHGRHSISCYESSAVISNCVIRNNSGSGLRCSNSDLTVRNCTFTGNRGSSIRDYGYETLFGGAILFAGGDISLINCTFSGNVADFGGGICICGSGMYYPYMNKMTISNCIFRDNVADNGPQIALIEYYKDNPPIVSVSYSDVEGGEAAVYVDPCCTLEWGDGNLGIDPCFAEPGYWELNGTPEDVNDDFWVDGDYHLKSQKGRWKPSIYIGLDPTADGFINLFDFSAFANSWQKQGGFIYADLDRSSTVELFDLRLLLDNYLSSYSLGEWVLDNVTSPCIDAGDPNSDKIGELWPHGMLINMGAYGGTPEASMSLSDEGNIADLNWDGSVGYADMILMGKWLYEGVLLAEDFDRNGFVNFSDFAIFAKNWQGSPGPASEPYPANDARLVDPNTDLSWTAGYGASSHDVYFGTSNPPPFIGNQTSTMLDPGTMSHSKYFWRIDEVNTGGKSTGTTWFFRTSIPPPPPPPPT